MKILRTMNEKKYPPLALKIVAYLSILAGIISLIGMISSFMTNHITINFGVIELFIGLGLLKGKKTWRSFALLIIWLMFLVIPIISIRLLAYDTTTTLKFLGLRITPVTTEVVMVFGSILLIWNIWQYVVFNRKDVLAYFDIKD